jgi:hypothetical protein
LRPSDSQRGFGKLRNELIIAESSDRSKSQPGIFRRAPALPNRLEVDVQIREEQIEFSFSKDVCRGFYHQKSANTKIDKSYSSLF